MTTTGEFRQAIQHLSNDQIKELAGMVARLQRLNLPPGSRFDLMALVDEVRFRPATDSPDDGHFDPLGKDCDYAATASSGRYYELYAVLQVPEDEARTQYRREWRRVRRLVADGLPMADAWNQVRHEARMAALLGDDEPVRRVRVHKRRKRRRQQ